jgi:hypothetical protein
LPVVGSMVGELQFRLESSALGSALPLAQEKPYE